MKKVVLSLLPIFLVACSQNTVTSNKDHTPENGMWRGAIALNDSVDLPFNFNLETTQDSSISLSIFNGDEEIRTSVSRFGKDSVRIEMPVFANYIEAKLSSNKLQGTYINPDAENYRLPFNATHGDTFRFEADELKCCEINKKWAVKFSPDTESERPAIAYFEQTGNVVHGTFTTETGDYRYLQGILSGNNLKLSTFDGAHLYVFTAKVDGQTMEGLYYSGRSFMEPWTAYRDDSFELRNADSLTYLKSGYYGIDFTFNDLNGNPVSLSDSKYVGKPVIVQIMGSWCPNCMDETRYLNKVYEQYHEEGLEIVGLTFERAKTAEIAKARASKMVNDLQIPYPILLAGATRDDKASELLPMLNRVMSFPTSIYLNADHSVHKIHTGFSGPGTPLYENFVAEDRHAIEEILKTQPGE